MVDKANYLGEMFVAVFTKIGFFPCMHTKMICESHLLRERFVALFTGIWLFSSMNSHMLLKPRLEKESFGAQFTYMWIQFSVWRSIVFVHAYLCFTVTTLHFTFISF
jgi:hypothetical protein